MADASTLLDLIREMTVALQGVVRVADRATDEFDAARTAIQKGLAATRGRADPNGVPEDCCSDPDGCTERRCADLNPRHDPSDGADPRTKDSHHG